MKRLAVLWGMIALVVFILGSSIFGKTGFITLYRLHTETRELEQKVTTKELERDSLREVKRRLQSDPSYIERVAREELGYCYKDETLLKIIPMERKE